MHEMKIYDGKGNLIEVVSAAKCSAKLWASFGIVPAIAEEDIGKNNQAHGMFHLMTTVKRPGIDKKCAHCGTIFQAPKHKKAAKYCSKPGVPEMQQCRRLAYRQKIIKPKWEVLCALCETPFQTSRANAKFCSNKQCNSNNYTVHHNAKGRMMNCHYCQGEFKASQAGNSKYCIMPYFVNTLQCRTLAVIERNSNKSS